MIRNRFTTEELQETQKTIKTHNENLLESIITEQALKQKQISDFLHRCENLFGYAINNEPEIFVKFIATSSTVKSKEIFSNIVLPMLNNGKSETDLFTINSIFSKLLETEFNAKFVKKPEQTSYFNVWNLLIQRFLRYHHETNALIKENLSEVVLDIVAKGNAVSSNMHRQMIFDNISEVAEICKIKNKSEGELMEVSEVAKFWKSSCSKLKDYVDKIVKVLVRENTKIVPYILQYQISKLAQLLAKNDVDEGVIGAILAEIIVEKFFSPIIQAPDAFNFYPQSSKLSKPEDLVGKTSRKWLQMITQLLKRCTNNDEYDWSRNPAKADAYNSFIVSKSQDLQKIVAKILANVKENSMKKFYKVTDFSKFSKKSVNIQLKIADLLDAIKLCNRFLTNEKLKIQIVPEASFFEQDQNFKSVKQVDIKSPTKQDISEFRVTLSLGSTDDEVVFSSDSTDEDHLHKVKLDLAKLIKMTTFDSDLDVYFNFSEYEKDSEEFENIQPLVSSILYSVNILKDKELLPKYGTFKHLTQLIRNDIFNAFAIKSEKINTLESLKSTFEDLSDKSKSLSEQLMTYQQVLEDSLSKQHISKGKDKLGNFKSKVLSFSFDKLYPKIVTKINSTELQSVPSKNIVLTMQSVTQKKFKVKIKMQKTIIY